MSGWNWFRVATAATAVVVIAAAGIAAWHLAASPGQAESIAAEAARARGGTAGAGAAAPDAAPVTRMLTVFVSGAVLHPGVYQLPRGARIADAIEAAGGLLADADPDKLPNLAGRLTDGKQVKVARRAGFRPAASARVDINSASVEELMTVPGLDISTAQEIVSERENYGPFTTLTELHTLLGLDTQVLAALRPYLTALH